MRSGRAPRALSVLALVLCSVLSAGGVPSAHAAPAAPQTYPGPEYSDAYPTPPTFPENQSKIWFHADAWWAMLLERDGRSVRVFELMADHSWRPTSAVVNPDAGTVGDALRVGDTVHVATRGTDESLQYVRLSFDAAARDYRVAPPSLVTTRGSLSPAALVEDSTGTLWIAYATFNDVLVTSSGDGGRTWAPLSVLAATGTGQTPETADLVAYDDRVGLLWSDQATGSFEFASHRDGDPQGVWSRETALRGPAEADDHISLIRVPGEPSDRLLAAVKTSQGDVGEAPGASLIELLTRSPEGVWSRTPVARVADEVNDPVVAWNSVTGTVHVFMSLYGNIVEKQAPLDDLRFPEGQGRLFVLGGNGGGRSGGLVDPTVSPEPVTAESGLVVLASDMLSDTFKHAEMSTAPAAPAADPADRTPPGPPEALQATAVSPRSVTLSWSAATDGERWWPAADGMPVSEYVVSRGGTEIATVTSTSFLDDDARGATQSGAAASLTYEVAAVDASGNRSPVARVSVTLPAAGGSDVPLIAGVGLLGLAACTAAVALHRRRVPPSGIHLAPNRRRAQAPHSGDVPVSNPR